MQSLTALYVEDRPINLVLMQAVFERRPQYRLLTASSCAQALRLAREHEADLLLLDLDLPDGHGSDLLRQLRALPAYKGVPAVAVTADLHFRIAGTSFAELWSKPLDLALTFRRLDGLAATGSLFGAGAALPAPLPVSLPARLRPPVVAPAAAAAW